jgi:hypothetical protein
MGELAHESAALQLETNTKIAVRGRGSIQEGKTRDPKYDHAEDDELHVSVTGNTQADVSECVPGCAPPPPVCCAVMCFVCARV